MKCESTEQLNDVSTDELHRIDGGGSPVLDGMAAAAGCYVTGGWAFGLLGAVGCAASGLLIGGGEYLAAQGI